jgi:hypothetical protein
MEHSFSPTLVLAASVLGLVCIFAFASVVIWTDARRREREALYRSELLKKLAETPGPGADAVLSSLRDDDRRRHSRRREAFSLAGMLCSALGVAVLIGHLATPDSRGNGAWALCFVPMLLGAVLIVHARVGMRGPDRDS